MSTSFLNNYLTTIEKKSKGISVSIKNTVDALIPTYIKTFSFRKHVTGLLLGNVQSGKTSQIFGVIAASADEGFKIFIMLTSDNVYLHNQTLHRAKDVFIDFLVCDENDDIAFVQGKLRKPTLIILKKNASVLNRWKNNLSSSGLCEGNGLFFVDDEADAASLNTKVNKNDQSTINRHLEEIKKIGNSSIYLQVTATPQALLLQTINSEWRPFFAHYFKPGNGYLGGEILYQEPPLSCIKFTAPNELDDLRNSDDIVDGLKLSLLSFLLTSAHCIQIDKKPCCNFLVHPSVKIADHKLFATKIGEYLNELLIAVSEDKLGTYFEDVWKDLKATKPSLISYEKANEFIKQILSDGILKIHLMNSEGSINIDCSHGVNIIVGGNSLGRGVTFPVLQTIYYCRTAKAPQADTYWQHSRIFGYDRDIDLVRIFIPPLLFKVFAELNYSNRILIDQISRNSVEQINLLFPPNIKPTRLNVIEKSALDIIVGGVNHFPNDPKEIHVKEIDDLLSAYSDQGIHETTINGIISLLELFDSTTSDDWSNIVFINCLKALKTISVDNSAYLIIRRNRSIGRATGTLLSPNDRVLGDSIRNHPVLTLYRIIGEKEKGWDGSPLWIPNIKLPIGRVFYKVDT